MKLTTPISIVAMLICMAICIDLHSAEANFDIIPRPQKVEATGGKAFNITPSTRIVYDSENRRNAQFLQQYIKEITGMELAITRQHKSKNAIMLSSKSSDGNGEGYTINVSHKCIAIEGNSTAGTFYGIQTLRKALPIGSADTVEVPATIITDSPRFGYRGTELDVSRHFFPADSVKRFLDILALHNVNRFHWHLTDDQGWRVEIKSRPQLTRIGSYRNQTTGDGKSHFGFYTQEQIRDIVAYAAERHITIIPEVDVPGHTYAALASYPELGCTGGPYKVLEQWGGGNGDVLCAGNNATIKFLEDVFNEIADLFPSEYIHIGGDECPKGRWHECPKCQAKIKELGIIADEKHSAEQKLQSYIMVSVENILARRGRKVIGWDEILEGGLGATATVHSWRGMEGAIEAVKQDHDAVLSPTSHCYFDYNPDVVTPINKVYSFSPIPESFSKADEAHILGVQANVWTEYIPTFQKVQEKTLPRLTALSEVQWSDEKAKDYESFKLRLEHMLRLFDRLGIKYYYGAH